MKRQNFRSNSLFRQNHLQSVAGQAFGLNQLSCSQIKIRVVVFVKFFADVVEKMVFGSGVRANKDNLRKGFAGVVLPLVGVEVFKVSKNRQNSDDEEWRFNHKI